MTTITLMDHATGHEYIGAFRHVRAISDDCEAGVTEIQAEDTTLFVATVINAGRVFAYHDWQTGMPEEVALSAGPDLGRWYDNATNSLAIWLDDKPHAL